MSNESSSTLSFIVIPLVVIAIATLVLPILAIIGLATKAQTLQNNTQNSANAVTIKDNKQTISVLAKGGYWPKTINAKADLQTTLKIQTQNTFDCSSSIFIPSLGIRDTLQPIGTKEIAIAPQNKGAIINGTCSMGMYSFQIIFE